MDGRELPMDDALKTVIPLPTLERMGCDPV